MQSPRCSWPVPSVSSSARRAEASSAIWIASTARSENLKGLRILTS